MYSRGVNVYICTFPSGALIHCKIPLSLFSSWAAPAVPAPSPGRCSSPSPPSGPFAGLSPAVPCLWCSRCGLGRAGHLHADAISQQITIVAHGRAPKELWKYCLAAGSTRAHLGLCFSSPDAELSRGSTAISNSHKHCFPHSQTCFRQLSAR